MTMLTGLSAYVKNIAMFLLFQSFINLIMPGEKFKAYINLVMGFILVAVVISPLAQISLFGKKSFDDLFRSHVFSVENKVFYDEKELYKNQNEDLVMETYKKNVETHIRDTVAKKEPGYGSVTVEACIETNKESSEYGTIKEVFIQLSNHAKESASTSGDDIEPVIVQLDDVYHAPVKTEPETEDEAHVKKIVKDFYNLSADNIHISVNDKTSQ